MGPVHARHKTPAGIYPLALAYLLLACFFTACQSPSNDPQNTQTLTPTPPDYFEKLRDAWVKDPSIADSYVLHRNINCMMARSVAAEPQPDELCYGEALSGAQLVETYCDNLETPPTTWAPLENQARTYNRRFERDAHLVSVKNLRERKTPQSLAPIAKILQTRSALKAAHNDDKKEAVLACAHAGAQEAKAANLPLEEAILLGSKGFILYQLDKEHDSLLAYKAARNIYLALNEPYYSRRMESNYALQHHYRLDQIEAHGAGIERGLEAYLATNQPTKVLKSLTKLSMNRYYQNEYLEAIEWADKGMEVADELGREDLSGLPLIALGHIKLSLGDVDGTRLAYRQALEVLPPDTQREYWASALYFLIDLEVYIARRNQGAPLEKEYLLELATKAQRLQEALGDSDASMALDLRITQAQLALLLGTPAEAEALSQSAQALMQDKALSLWQLKLTLLNAAIAKAHGDLPGALIHYDRAVDGAKEIDEAEMMWQALLGRAQIHLATGHKKKGIDDLAEAVNLVEKHWLYLNQGGGRVSESENSAYYLEAQITLYDLIIDALLHDEAHAKEAWWWLERRRSNQLRLRLVQAAENERPRQAQTLLQTVQEALAPGEILVEYHISPTQAAAFLIGNQHFERVLLTGDANTLHGQVRKALPFLTGEDDGSNALYSKELTPIAKDLLWPLLPKLKGAKSLFIIPDGQLSLLPFEALPLSPGADAQPLLTAFTTSYHVSTMELGRQKPTPNGKDARLLSLSLNHYPESNAYGLEQPLPALPCAQYESKDIVEVGVDTHLSNEAAHEGNFTSMAGDYDILHIATHGLVSHGNYMGTYLALWPHDGSDGHLTLSEITRMELNAQLAIVPACRSAVAKLFRGEGIQGVGTAFNAAGIPSTIVGLWALPDVKGTSEITVRLMHYLRTGMGIAAALQRAKLDVYAVEKDLRIWAPLVLFGQDQTLYTGKRPVPALRSLDGVDMKEQCPEPGIFEQMLKP